MSGLTAIIITIVLYVSIQQPAASTVIPDESQTSPLTCNSCCQGPAGLNGVPGVPGTPGGFGPPGPVGPKGDVGISMKGDKGDVGERGLIGSQGPRGSSGAPGKVGPVGIQGPSGQDGLDGVPGSRGLKGEKGETGIEQFSGFTVVKTSTQSVSGIVTFESVITNAAGHFNTNSHKFVCQIPGFYWFTYTIGARDENGPGVYLNKNGASIVMSYTHPAGSHTNNRNMGTNSALLQLTRGDEVWLHKKHTASDRVIYGDPTWPWTTFSGVLLHET